MSNGTITKHTSGPFVTAGYADAPLLDLLTALGHGNGSGSTEEFINLPSHVAYNAANFGNPSDSDSVKATAAIVAAKAAGVKYVWVPASMRPSAATFDPAVMMVREGQGNWDEFDIIAYGADRTGAVDSYTAIQTCLDHCDTGTLPSRTVRIPPTSARFLHSKPLLMKVSGTKLLGCSQSISSGTGQSRLTAAYSYGQGVIVTDAAIQVTDIIPALATGTGSAWKPSSPTLQSFNLRESATLDIHGLAALTVELYYKPDALMACNLITSGGRYSSLDAFASAFSLDVTSSQPRFTVNLSTSGTKSVTGGTLSAGTTYHIAGTYDGSTVRLFLDGALVASTAGTGTIVQDVAEEVEVGVSHDIQPNLTTSKNAPPGTIDSPHVSDSARYVAPFTKPTAKFIADAHTLIVLNFVEQVGPCSKASITSGGVAWLWFRESSTALAGAASCEIRGIQFSAAVEAGGISVGPNSGNLIVDQCSFYNCRTGIFAPFGDAYFWRFSNLYLNTISRHGIAIGSPGIGQMENIQIFGAAFPLLLMSSLMPVTNVYIVGTANLINGLVLGNVNSSPSAGISLRSVTVDTESGPGTTFRGSLRLIAGCGVRAEGCIFESAQNLAALYIEGGASAYLFDNCLIAGTTSAMTAHGTFTRPVKFRDCVKSASLPWSDTAGTATAIQSGRLDKAFSATPTLDFNDASEWTIGQLSDNITAQTWQYAGDGQPIVVRYHQNDSAAKTVAAPSNVIGWTAISATLGSISEFRGSYDQGLGKFVGSMFAGLT